MSVVPKFLLRGWEPWKAVDFVSLLGLGTAISAGRGGYWGRRGYPAVPQQSWHCGNPGGSYLLEQGACAGF